MYVYVRRSYVGSSGRPVTARRRVAPHGGPDRRRTDSRTTSSTSSGNPRQRRSVVAVRRGRAGKGVGLPPPHTRRVHGMKTRLDEDVPDVPAGMSLTLDASSTLLSFLVSVLASDISSRANHSKTLGNPRFHGENSRYARSHCLYDEERWRLAWVTWHLVKPQSGSSSRRPAPAPETTRVATYTSGIENSFPSFCFLSSRSVFFFSPRDFYLLYCEKKISLSKRQP